MLLHSSKDGSGQKLAYVYYEEEPGRRSAAKLLTKDEARRIAANVAKLPSLLSRPSPDHEKLFVLSENVRTYTEQNVSDSLRSNIGNALQNARRVVFLGFGFHQQNMALLQATGSHESWRRVVGTVQGIDSENWEFMKVIIGHATKCTPLESIQLLNRPAYQLLSTMRPSLMT